MKKDKSLIQIKKGALEYCVLAVIAEGEKYGYEIVKVLTERGLTTHEGTIYPLLSRLHKEGLVQAAWRESGSAVPRKYYRATRDGMRALNEFKESWSHFSQSVDGILWGEQ
ncbi:transcriptional regulator, PadR-like family [Dethiobacter alkaliphilus AHT 1]|uniref:Transcriptional regulator, PadR-like family n=2 Tax=Dethiobacter TaxID=427925 RepID=C0GEF9_DETAL|nr:transcriptional regulator, PadR-like family [Dethiobacter alkaliphilus AHT 1]